MDYTPIIRPPLRTILAVTATAFAAVGALNFVDITASVLNDGASLADAPWGLLALTVVIPLAGLAALTRFPSAAAVTIAAPMLIELAVSVGIPVELAGLAAALQMLARSSDPTT